MAKARTVPLGREKESPNLDGLGEGNVCDASGKSVSVCLVGPGWRFTSGISYYTCRFANALAEDYETSVIQLRQLLPRVFYPGKERVAQHQPDASYREDVPVFNGINWWWGLSLVRSMIFLGSHRPRVLVLQWWTLATLHTYLVLALVSRIFGARLVIDMHESQDPGEASFGVLRLCGQWGLGLLLRTVDGVIVHSEADQKALSEIHDTRKLAIAVAPLGPFDQYMEDGADEVDVELVESVRSAPRPGVINLLFFGLIRPYKGLEDLLAAFESMPDHVAASYWLTIVGETWEMDPSTLIENSCRRDRITFVNKYVPDRVVAAAFGHADVVVLPYRRSSGSAALQVAMSWGLPVVVTDVGGLSEAVKGYAGAVSVPPGDARQLMDGIVKARSLAGQEYASPRSWRESSNALLEAAGLRKRCEVG